MPVEPGIHDRPADVVEVVLEVGEVGAKGILGLAEHLIEFLDLWKAFPRHEHFPGPVVGCGHADWLGGEEGGNLDVARSDAQQACVLAGAPSLHGTGDHAVGEGSNGPGVQGPKQDGLGASATAAGDPDTVRVDVGQGGEEIEGPEGIPSLNPKDRLEPELGLGAVQPPAVRTLEAGPLLGKAVG